MSCMILGLPWMLLCAASHITILYIHALASCISSRYARWTTWRMWGWNRTRRQCMEDFSRRWKDPWSTCLNRGCSPSECHLTNTDLVLDSRQAPEHSKSPSVLQNITQVFMIDALGYKSWMEPLDAYKFLVQRYTPLTLCRSRIEHMLSHASYHLRDIGGYRSTVGYICYRGTKP